MKDVSNVLILMRRRDAIESAMRKPGGVRIIDEQELYLLRARLNDFPEVMHIVHEVARGLRRPVSELSVRDVEAWTPTA